MGERVSREAAAKINQRTNPNKAGKVKPPKSTAGRWIGLSGVLRGWMGPWASSPRVERKS